jgi:two-component sensor histidine kinase
MLTREDYHDIKNQIAIALGMTDLTLRSLKKDPSKLDAQKIMDRSEKSLKALERILALVDKGHQALKKEAALSNSAEKKSAGSDTEN